MTSFALITAWALGGLAFGFGYFAALRHTAELLAGGRARLVPVALTLGRFAAAILFLGLAAKTGAMPLLAAFLGILLARLLAMRAAQRTA